uniref:Uncharacterized protein n=2 Tax=Choreotrichia TaxID=141411 RepID=A0A7S3MJ14_9SPIT|mmetsp:Transcript_14422/g.18234  ORF Transcript_14422/g.18234 Transcript_14422/m.18234 type:complete len:187 (+) Transcript_14422:24-584(+)
MAKVDIERQVAIAQTKTEPRIFTFSKVLQRVQQVLIAQWILFLSMHFLDLKMIAKRPNLMAGSFILTVLAYALLAKVKISSWLLKLFLLTIATATQVVLLTGLVEVHELFMLAILFLLIYPMSLVVSQFYINIEPYLEDPEDYLVGTAVVYSGVVLLYGRFLIRFIIFLAKILREAARSMQWLIFF